MCIRDSINAEYMGIYISFVAYVVTSLVKAGVPGTDIGVISPYNEQRNLLVAKLERLRVDCYAVDKSQGIDKECIVILCTVKGKLESILSNWRRINVAFTRAKKKLIVVGSIEDLKGINTMDSFIKVMQQRRWVLDLEEAAVKTIADEKKKEKQRLLARHAKKVVGSQGKPPLRMMLSQFVAKQPCVCTVYILSLIHI
eukprot:TRINITY_DN13820_c0_g1_i4.p1 TRINITY_DN13820_c0_g1~~TRINITY_DN13820_c0_g1_i4.p1  ORF type:complete len:198 (-),score=51.71 TRINITY_DN13820_c0_g1_i4:61-654(-)